MSQPCVPTTPAKTGPTVLLVVGACETGTPCASTRCHNPFLPAVVLFSTPPSSSSFRLTRIFGIQPLEGQGWLAHPPAGRRWCCRGNGGRGFVVQVLQHLFDV